MPKNTALIGDIDIPRINWEEMTATGARGQELLNVVLEEELEQLVLFYSPPTKKVISWIHC